MLLPYIAYVDFHSKEILSNFSLSIAWCDGFSRPARRRDDFVSSSSSSSSPSALTVNFLSFAGSYSGSSLQWWAQYDFFDGRTDGLKVEGTSCDEVFTPSVKARAFR